MEQNSKFCPSCGSKLDIGDKFCAKCGFSIQGDETQGSPVQPDLQNKSKVKPVFILIAALIIIPLVFLAARTAVTTVTKKAIEDKLALAEKYLFDEEYEQAILAYREVIDIAPKEERAYTGLAKVYIVQEDYESAEEVLIEGIQIVEQTISLRRDLFKIYVIQEKFEDAEAVFLEFLEKEEDWGEAVRLAERALELNNAAFNFYRLLYDITGKQEYLEIVNEKVIIIEKRGNSGGNISNEGIVTLHGEWIYFSNTSDGGKIYKINIDGSGLTRINNDDSKSLNVVDDWVYYRNDDDNLSIYKIKTDGSGRTRLSEHTWILEIIVIDDWIYYSNYASDSFEECGIYKMKTDSSELIRLNYLESELVDVIDGWIYFTEIYGNAYPGEMYRMRIDGTDTTLVNKDWSTFVNIVDDWIYYVYSPDWRIQDDNRGIYKISTDGSGRTLLSNESDIGSLNVSGEWLYFTIRDYNYRTENDPYTWAGNIYKMRTNGSGFIKISDHYALNIQIAGEWLYYENSFDGRLYKIKKNGRDLQPVF